MNRRVLLVGAALIVVGVTGFVRDHARINALVAEKTGLTKRRLAQVLKDSATFYKFPTEMDLPLDMAPTPIRMAVTAATPSQKSIRAKIDYAFEPKLQASMESLIKQYHPDYGAFVAIDPKTGRVLSMVSYSGLGDRENLTLRSTFPSASVFKVVTAAAAIEAKKFSANTVISFNGRNHTLYRSAVLSTKLTRWTRYMTLRDAFANSVNTVFGKIGAFTVGADGLSQYASRFGFNREIASDVPVQEGHAPIPAGDDPWGLAETASGFTRDNTMSPLQGALIAAAIVNDGVMMEPYIVRSVSSMDGVTEPTPGHIEGPVSNPVIYTADPKIASFAVDPRTAVEIRKLMNATVKQGTSRKSFRGFFKAHKGYFANYDVGGKTGSLTGTDPKGKYDWFVGFADDRSGRKIAVAALTIHEKLWRVKSSFLARKAIEEYYRDLDQGNN